MSEKGAFVKVAEITEATDFVGLPVKEANKLPEELKGLFIPVVSVKEHEKIVNEERKKYGIVIDELANRIISKPEEKDLRNILFDFARNVLCETRNSTRLEQDITLFLEKRKEFNGND